MRGFERGADDFVAKPFSYGELRLRLAAVLRRTRERRGRGRLRVGELELDPASREVRLRGRRVSLSQKEFALLRALAADPTRVLTKEELLRDVWGFRRSARPARSTRTPAACATSSVPGATGSWSTCGASATGSSTARWRRRSRRDRLARAARVGAGGERVAPARPAAARARGARRSRGARPAVRGTAGPGRARAVGPRRRDRPGAAACRAGAGRPLRRRARPAAGERLQAVDVGRLLADAEHAWRALAAAYGAALEIDGGRASVVGDRLRLAQACGNLVANAVEHGGGCVRVRASSGRARPRRGGRFRPGPAGAGSGARTRGARPAIPARARAGDRRGDRGAPRRPSDVRALARGAHLVLDLPEAR